MKTTEDQDLSVCLSDLTSHEANGRLEPFGPPLLASPPGPERPRGRAVRSDLAARHCCRSAAPGAARPAAASQRVHYLLNSS